MLARRGYTQGGKGGPSPSAADLGRGSRFVSGEKARVRGKQ